MKVYIGGCILVFAAGMRVGSDNGMMRVSQHHLSDGEVEAAIFDWDGTLCDSMSFYYQGWQAAAQQFDFEVTEEMYYRAAGLPLEEMAAQWYKEHHGLDDIAGFDVEGYVQAAKAINSNNLEQGLPEGIQPIINIAISYHNNGIPIAIATSNRPERVLPQLQNIPELHDIIGSKIVYNKDVANGKPHPDIYLKAADLLGVHPSKCRVYEDGESGLQAGVAAGMHVLDVTFHDEYPRSEGLMAVKHEQIEARNWKI